MSITKGCEASALKAEFQIKTIEGRIKGFAKALSKLAAHPDKPEHRGPLFISLQSQFKPAAEYDGMLGSMVLEGFLGGAFSGAANDNAASGVMTYIGANDLDILGDMLSEYLEERNTDKRYGAGRGKGSLALGEHKTICNQFNDTMDDALLAYSRDIAQRENIEQSIAGLQSELMVAKREAAFIPAYA